MLQERVLSSWRRLQYRRVIFSGSLHNKVVSGRVKEADVCTMWVLTAEEAADIVTDLKRSIL